MPTEPAAMGDAPPSTKKPVRAEASNLGPTGSDSNITGLK